VDGVPVAVSAAVGEPVSDRVVVADTEAVLLCEDVCVTFPVGETVRVTAAVGDTEAVVVDVSDDVMVTEAVTDGVAVTGAVIAAV
jgi:hypothetical protein